MVLPFLFAAASAPASGTPAVPSYLDVLHILERVTALPDASTEAARVALDAGDLWQRIVAACAAEVAGTSYEGRSVTLRDDAGDALRVDYWTGTLCFTVEPNACTGRPPSVPVAIPCGNADPEAVRNLLQVRTLIDRALLYAGGSAVEGNDIRSGEQVRAA